MSGKQRAEKRGKPQLTPHYLQAEFWKITKGHSLTPRQTHKYTAARLQETTS